MQRVYAKGKIKNAKTSPIKVAGVPENGEGKNKSIHRGDAENSEVKALKPNTKNPQST
jgi:hypothetical protein